LRGEEAGGPRRELARQSMQVDSTRGRGDRRGIGEERRDSREGAVARRQGRRRATRQARPGRECCVGEEAGGPRRELARQSMQVDLTRGRGDRRGKGISVISGVIELKLITIVDVVSWI
jgi:hypothetical protein